MAAAAGAWLWGWLWNERYWFPANVTWADLEQDGPDGESLYPRARHLLVVFPLAAGLLVLRQFFERFIAKPFAMHFGIQENGPCRARPNAILEKVFTSIAKCPDARRLEGLSKQLDWDVRKIQRWFRHRRNQEKPSIFTKFCESLWRLVFYSIAFPYGLRIIWWSPWISDTKHCWYSFPHEPLTPRIYNYYVMELTFYLSLLFSQFIDTKRKDFLIMFIHHISSVCLIALSYIINMVPIGTLVLSLHDAPDIFLENIRTSLISLLLAECPGRTDQQLTGLLLADGNLSLVAKLSNYAKYQRLCDATFILFSVIFTVTRLGIFPFWILNSTWFESWEIIGPYRSWGLFNGLLLIIQILHVFWSYFIIRTAYKALLRGKVAKDERSDIESSSEEEDTTSNSRKGILNTSTNGANRINGHITSGKWAEEE